jgi:MFS family permease
MSAADTSAAIPFTDRQVRRGLRLNVVAGSFGMAWVAVALNVPFVMLLDALGASGVVLGVSATVRQIAILTQIPSSLVFETLRRRKWVWGALACVHRLLWLVPAWLAWTMPQSPVAVNLILAAVIVSTVIENLAVPAWFSWMADLVPEDLRGRFWSGRQAALTTAFLVAIGLAGLALDAFPPDGSGPLAGFALVFAVGAVFGVADIVIHLGVPEPPAKVAFRDQSWIERILAPLQYPSFRNLALAMGAWMFACAMSGTFSAVYLKRVFGVSYSGLSAITICASIGTVAASIAAGYLIDRIGARAFAVVLMLVAPLFGACWFFVTATPAVFHLPWIGEIRTSQATLLIGAVSLFSGGVYATVGLCHLNLLGALAPERGRTLAMAVHWTLIGLVGAAGPIVGGYVVDWMTAYPSRLRLFGGTRLDFMQVLVVLHAAVIWVAALPLMLRVRAQREPLTVTEAFERVLMVNPLRFASGVYHARVLASPSRRARRRAAAEAIGAAGTEIALADLTARLDDPVSDVREAAVRALGRIGTPEAVAALRRRLDDPSGDLAVAAVRALRDAPPDSALVPALLAFLGRGDGELVRETARTLGALGDARAVPPLVELLHRTRHDALAAVAAEALGRLGDISAVYVILPRLRTATGTFLRRALAVACGDLLGTPDGFYRLLTREDASHGSGIAEPLRAAHRTLRRAARRNGGEAWQAARGLLHELDALYERRAIRECAACAFRLALTVARGRHGADCNGQIVPFLTALDTRDPRFTVGVWFLAILDGAFARSDGSASLAPAQDLLEIQLAVYVVSSWAREVEHPGPVPFRCALSLTGAVRESETATGPSPSP